MATNYTQVLMIPFLHFGGEDHILFEAWQPLSGGTTAGACVGLFFFAMFERWFNAVSPALIHYLMQRKSQSYAKPSKDCAPSPHPSSKSSNASTREKRHLPPRTAPPFIVGVDIPRGIIYAFQRLLGFALMMIVMTFHAGYILSVIIGLTSGEILFGRARYGVVKDD